MMKTLTIAAAAILLASPALATSCKTYTEVTADNAPVNRTGVKTGPSPGFTKQGNMASILRVCTDPNSTHRFAKKMHELGNCEPNGMENETLAQPVTPSELFKYVTLDGLVPDIDTHRYGIVAPFNVPGTPWTPPIVKGEFYPLPGNAGREREGACP